MILRVCDSCGRKHTEFFRVNILVKASNVRARRPDESYPTPEERDAYRLSTDGRAEVALEICTVCALDIEFEIIERIKKRESVRRATLDNDL